MNMKIRQWFLITTAVGIFGCLHYEEPLSRDFGRIRYYLRAYRDSLNLMILSSDLILDYRIRGRKGRTTGGLNFLMPMTDTVTITWYNRSGDSMVVPLRMNKAVFDSLPLANNTTAKVFHPGISTRDYYV